MVCSSCSACSGYSSGVPSKAFPTMLAAESILQLSSRRRNVVTDLMASWCWRLVFASQCWRVKVGRAYLVGKPVFAFGVVGGI